MPEEGVSDLRDVVDAINKLCDTMKTSHYDDAENYEECVADDAEVSNCESTVVPQYADSVSEESAAVEPYDYETRSNVPRYTECYTDLISPAEISVQRVETHSDVVSTEESESLVQKAESYRDLVSPEEIAVQRVEAFRAERWSDSQISLPGQTEDVQTITSDTESGIAQFEPISEMYYTASSEVSLLSDLDLPDRAQVDSDFLPEKEAKDDRKEYVIAGHVAAMRERFESMTRANTPCPDLIRSTSPSLDVFRNITPSPDQLG